MHTKDSKGIVDTEESKRMGIAGGGNGTRTPHDQKKEIWTRHENKRILSGQRNHARHYTGSKKTRETKDAVDGQHGTMDRNGVRTIRRRTIRRGQFGADNSAQNIIIIL